MSKETAKFVVHRDGVDYGVTGFNIQVDCQEGDIFYVQRGDTVYKWPRKFYEKDWEAQDFWFHLQHGDLFFATDTDGVTYKVTAEKIADIIQ